jgi:hypothetical protein
MAYVDSNQSALDLRFAESITMAMLSENDTHHTMEILKMHTGARHVQEHYQATFNLKLMNISHFVLCPIPAWGKNYHSSLCSFKNIYSICLIGHIRPFGVLATRLVREQETIIATFIVAPHLLVKTRTEVSRQFLDEPSESSKALQRIR